VPIQSYSYNPRQIRRDEMQQRPSVPYMVNLRTAGGAHVEESRVSAAYRAQGNAASWADECAKSQGGSSSGASRHAYAWSRNYMRL
jgi:hypothetical protein